MNKRFAQYVILSLLIVLSIPCWAQSQYFTGDGGKGIRLAVLEPSGKGLSKGTDDWMLSLIQSSITGDLQKYSAMTIIDRQNIEKILAEQKQSTSGNYSDKDYISIGKLINARYILAGSLTKTPTAYMLELAVTDAESGERKASYSPKPVSPTAIENLSALKEASIDLLGQLGVKLTATGLQELKSAANMTRVQAETALAKGVTAQKQGTEVAALSYYFQAAAIDPTMLEAVSRSTVLSANISSGNIGEDARNDIQWRKDWVARLTETEQYFNSFFDNFLKTLPSPYTLIYYTNIKQIGEINYQNETINLSGITASLSFSQDWVKSVETVFKSMQSSIQAIHNGLNATGRIKVWGLDKWQGNFNQKPFGKQVKNFTIVVELVNSKNKVIGKETFQIGGSYEFPVPLPGNKIQIQITADGQKTVNFSNVKANDITDSLTVRITSINGTPAETAARNGILQIRTGEEFEDEKRAIEAERIRVQKEIDAERLRVQKEIDAEKRLRVLRENEAEWFANNMLRIQGGTFTMGSPVNEPNRDSDEIQHQVTVSSFYMGKYEVTQKEYKEVMGTNPSYDHYKGGDNLPVEQVSWYDAIEYCNRRSQIAGLTQAYTRNGDTVTWNRDANGYRLPTEAEWEYACRAGTTTAYNTGAKISKNTGWYYKNSGGNTHPVGQNPANAWGLYDMHGNVSEWCWDWKGDYSNGSQTDPMGASSGTGRVRRGGSWSDSAENLRSAYRRYYNPFVRRYNLGFRLVRP